MPASTRRRLQLQAPANWPTTTTTACDRTYVYYHSRLNKVVISDDDWHGGTRFMHASSRNRAAHASVLVSWPTATTQSKSKMSEGRVAEVTRWTFFLELTPGRRPDNAFGGGAAWELAVARVEPPLEPIGSEVV